MSGISKCSWRKVGRCVAGSVAGFGLASGLALADASPADQRGRSIEKIENATKAEMVYRIAERVEWPSEDDGPFLICLVGETSLRGYLEKLSGRRMGAKEVEVRYFASVEELEYCPVLVIAASEAPRQRQILSSLGDKPVLTMGEAEDFAESGGIVEFCRRVNTVSYCVNPSAAKRAGLKIDKSVLKLAKNRVGN